MSEKLNVLRQDVGQALAEFRATNGVSQVSEAQLAEILELQPGYTRTVVFARSRLGLAASAALAKIQAAAEALRAEEERELERQRKAAARAEAKTKRGELNLERPQP